MRFRASGESPASAPQPDANAPSAIWRPPVFRRIKNHFDHAIDHSIHSRENPPATKPRRLAVEARTDWAFSTFPSIAQVATTSNRARLRAMVFIAPMCGMTGAELIRWGLFF
jgi:hypothetical protein